jgi:hypothetical protein
MSVNGVTPENYSSDFVANWLNLDVTDLIIKQAATREGISPPTEADLAAAKIDLIGSMDSTIEQAAGSKYQCSQTASQIFASMPSSFVASQVEAQAYSEALLIKHGGLGVDPASVEAYYNAHISDFDIYCVSGIESTDPTVYQSVTAGLAAGSTFAELAKKYSQVSNASSGGVFGCYAPATPGYSSLVSDAQNLTVGKPSGPIVASSTTVLILLVTSRTHTAFSGISDIVRRTILAKDATASSAVATAIVRSADVTVNPPYGAWSAKKAETGVIPPPVPATSSLLNAGAIQPGASGS